MPNAEGLALLWHQVGAGRAEGGGLVQIALDGLIKVRLALGLDREADVILEAARRAGEVLGEPSQILGRLGTNRLGLLLPGFDEGTELERLATDLIGLLNRPYRVGAFCVYLSCSAGCAAGQGPTDFVDLETRSLFALESARDRGAGVCSLYCPSLHSRSCDEFRVQQDFLMAIEQDRLEVHYQPQVEIETGIIFGAEALVRWRHATKGLLTPSSFLRQVTEPQIRARLTEWVLRRALRDWAACTSASGTDLRLAVNIGPRQLADEAFCDSLVRLVSASSVPPERLELELTEAEWVAEGTPVQSNLVRLSGTGIRIAIDDFGVGYSSLGYLRRLPIDTLKLDRSFVLDLGEGNPRAEAVVALTVGFAGALGLDLVAEGVESEDQCRALSRAGVTQLQGFFFCRPLSLEHFLTLLEARRGEGLPLGPVPFPPAAQAAIDRHRTATGKPKETA